MKRSKPTLLAASMLVMSVTGFAQDLPKETSLVTKQAVGELSVAGRLSIDLHAEFMLSRDYGTERALNWFNCGYSGGGAGGTKVGGNFGFFGFQVPFAERELRYPLAIKEGNVPAVRFDGDDFLKSNTAIEPSIVASRNMATISRCFSGSNTLPRISARHRFVSPGTRRATVG